MTKLTFIFYIILVTVLIMHRQVAEVFRVEQPVDKQISLAVYSNNNYSSSAYNDAAASLRVTVYKIRGNKKTIALDKTFDSMQLKSIPDMRNAINNSITVTNVLNSKEKLLIEYTITYDTKGSIVCFSNNKVISNDTAQDKLDINI